MVTPDNKTTKLIVIGNGFDIAHGIQSKYENFLDYLLGKYTDDLHITDPNNLSDSSDIFSNINTLLLKKVINDKSAIKKNMQSQHGFTFRNSFLEKVLRVVNIKDWVDVEDSYYSAIKDNYRGSLGDQDLSTINDGFEKFKNNFENYLSDKVHKNKVEKIEGMQSIFKCKKEEEVVILNFNYTQTPNLYIDSNVKVVNIHGQLKDKENPIIFGVGDESHSLYKELEEANNDEYLKNVKSMKYLLTNNYIKLINELNTRPFEVHILGYSCGISDRTLLKQIYNNENCLEQGIHIYHYDGKKSFEDSIYGISRYFDTNVKMRDKVAEFDSKKIIPQRK